jgi:hypothetical protein
MIPRAIAYGRQADGGDHAIVAGDAPHDAAAGQTRRGTACGNVNSRRSMIGAGAKTPRAAVAESPRPSAAYAGPSVACPGGVNCAGRPASSR